MSQIETRLTKEFLESILNLKLISINVTPGTKPGDNYMSVIYSIQALSNSASNNGNSDAEIVHNWIFKCLPSHPLRQEFAIKTNMFYKELFIYTNWISELRRFQMQDLKVKVPLEPAFAEFVGGQCKDFHSYAKNKTENSTEPLETEDPFENFIILKDIRPEGFKMCDRQLGMDFDHLSLVVKELAKYHAITWAYKCFHKLSSITDKYPELDYQMDQDDLEVTLSILQNSIETSVEALDDQFGTVNCYFSTKLRAFQPKCEQILKTFYSRSDERVLDDIFPSSESNSDRIITQNDNELWRVPCHGDCWINNILFKYETDNENHQKPIKLILIDHAVARELCPTVELAYLIYTSTTRKIRLNNLDNLLLIYHDEFLKTCEKLNTQELLPGFSLEMLKFKFRRAKLYGFVIALLALPDFLKNSDDIVDLDEMAVDSDEDSAVFKKSMSNPKINRIFQTRIVGLVKEMDALGILY